MSEFRTIEIDFDIHKFIESERRSFSESPNEVLRRILKLPAHKTSIKSVDKKAEGRPWSGEGVTLPHLTAARMRYNRKLYEGEILNGMWVIENKAFDSPSGAASGVAITKRGRRTRLDGWNYWEVKLPGETDWIGINTLRRRANSSQKLVSLSDF